jgi:hypothetical protein
VRSPLVLTNLSVLLAALVLGVPRASAQAIESVGARALGMGGAFVAVANDSSATWWNPAGLAAGPFVDVTLGTALAGAGDEPGRARTWAVAVATPALGASYYRLRITHIDSLGPTAVPQAGRQEGRVGIPSLSLNLGQLGVTVVHSLFPRVHAGATLKLVRGTVEGTGRDSTESHADADVGLLGIFGPVRLGVAARNLAEPSLYRSGDGQPDARLSRQVRVGVAYDGDRPPPGLMRPFTLSLDADVLAYDTVRGPRRVLAAGAERWLAARRIGVRGGARFNQVGARERAASIGASFVVVRGVMVEGHVTAGSRGERGWGVVARAAF